MKKQQTASVADIFARALQACSPQPGTTVAIALSGGLDSSALLHLAHAWSKEEGVALRAFHVHHGLSPNADAWLTHCEQLCASLDVPFEAVRVSIEINPKTGTEEAARKRRYAALGALCAQHGVHLLLTAHHQDDQAETVLLQLLRGSGTAGLSGMDGANSAPELLANPDLVMARPLLPVSRKQLEAYVAKHGIAHIHDESNDDARFARNALRHQVMPVLAQAFPGFQERFARSAQHAQSAQRLLTELATQDLSDCLDGECIKLSKLRELSQDRCYNLLRHWFGTRKLRMPSTAWLAEMLAQLLEARPDAQLLVTHPECHVRRHRDRLYLTPKLDDLAGMRERDDANIPGLEKAGQDFHWQGEASLAFPAYGGELHFDPVDEGGQGIDIAWLKSQLLTIDFRQGGERLKLALNRPTKSLKYHYQAFDVPAWERERLPLVCAAQQLLYAAGIGLDCHCLGANDAPRVTLRWAAA